MMILFLQNIQSTSCISCRKALQIITDLNSQQVHFNNLVNLHKKNGTGTVLTKELMVVHFIYHWKIFSFTCN